MSEKKLMPCPFCGGKVVAYEGVAHIVFFRCSTSTCGAIVSFDTSYLRRHPKEATEVWNRRVEVLYDIRGEEDGQER